MMQLNVITSYSESNINIDIKKSCLMHHCVCFGALNDSFEWKTLKKQLLMIIDLQYQLQNALKALCDVFV